MKKLEDTVNKFMLGIAYPEYLEHSALFKSSIYQNKTDYICLITESLDQFCKQIVVSQNNNQKEAIKYIVFNCLYTSFFQGHNEFVITAHDFKGYDDETSLSFYFDIKSYLNPLVALRKTLLEKSMPYLQHRDVLKIEIEKLILQGFRYYVEAFIQLVRVSYEVLNDNENFKAVEKHLDFQLIAGEYYDKGVLIHGTQNTYSTNKKCCYRIACQKDHIIHGFFQKKLLIEDACYDAYDFRYSSFPSSSFKDCSFKKNILSNTTFTGSHFKNVDFSESIGHDSIFDRCHFEKITCQRFYSDTRVVEGLSLSTGFIGLQCKKSVLKQVNFNNSILYGANFQDTHFIDCDFSSCDLSMANFKGAYFENVSFENSTLKDAYIENYERIPSLTKAQINELKGE